jgi:hypothetical protein
VFCAGRGPQDAKPSARRQGLKDVAGAEHLVVVMRQDEDSRARPGALVARKPVRRLRPWRPGHKAMVR